MGVVWNMYKGLRAGACTLKELQFMTKEHNLKP